MRLEANKTESRDNGTTLQLFDQGIRRVVRGDSEAWHTVLIIPREALIDGIRRRRAAGAQFHDCDWWTLIKNIGRWVANEGGSGPGRPFARRPFVSKSRNRRFFVIQQTGGLDI